LGGDYTTGGGGTEVIHNLTARRIHTHNLTAHSLLLLLIIGTSILTSRPRILLMRHWLLAGCIPLPNVMIGKGWPDAEEICLFS
jgi:hypothetical protein